MPIKGVWNSMSLKAFQTQHFSTVSNSHTLFVDILYIFFLITSSPHHLKIQDLSSLYSAFWTPCPAIHAGASVHDTFSICISGLQICTTLDLN